MEKKAWFNFWFAILAVLGVLFLQELRVQSRTIEPIACSEFIAQLKEHNVEEATVSANAIQVTLRKPLPNGRKQFTTRIDPDLAATNRPEILDPALLRAGRFDRHALVALALPGQDPVQKISIIPRGISALGYPLQRPTEDCYLMTSSALTHKMAVLLGGRAAEQLIFGEVSTGAADDLTKVTDIARSIVARYRMHANLGRIVSEEPRRAFLDVPGLEPSPRSYSEDTARAIDEDSSSARAREGNRDRQRVAGRGNGGRESHSRGHRLGQRMVA